MYITVFCIAIFITTSACTDSLVLENTKFDGDQIWSASVSDVGACAKACVRLKPCASFNYDISSKVCDLKTDTADLFPENVNYGVGMFYSAIAGWPESVCDFSD